MTEGNGSQKKVYELERSDLGKVARYEFGQGSVIVGPLESIQHYRAHTHISLDGVGHSVKDPDAFVTFK